MKKLISLFLVSIFISSSLLMCYASNFYDDYNNPYAYQQPIFVPVPVSPNNPPTVINNTINNTNSNGVSIQKILKWATILGGLTYLYFKFGNPITYFIYGLSKVSDSFKNKVFSNKKSSDLVDPNTNTKNSSFKETVLFFVSGLTQKVSDFFKGNISSNRTSAQNSQEDDNLGDEEAEDRNNNSDQSYFEKVINSTKVTFKDFLNAISVLSFLGFFWSDKTYGEYFSSSQK